MVKVTGVRFKKAGKIYYFDPADLDIKKNDDVIVETARGIEYGKAVIGIKEINEEEIVSPLKNVIRIATEEDREKHKINKEKEKEAFDIFIDKIEKHSLIMKLIDVEYTFDNNKIIFYFTADGRVDFRELVKDLASVFRTRIELRQIGVRDEAKMISGLGPCGRPLCCSTFLGEFVPVSIKMAKEQNLSLNPSKISGICGRLMCCLTYEQESYEDVRDRMPKVDSIVMTPFGKGTVVENNLLRETLKVKITITENEEIKLVNLSDVELISGHFEADKEYEEDIKRELKSNEDREALEELFKEN
ncbi:PSP1 domain-containing protein [Oceanirhabdus sp. W0125-5]|uniref:PSP1 domain-containing protein n=1 Tax=Oceanirhabdus sp. W0125-5 TaxID=2999116 RepID=UPI0022F2CA5B|nr:stage 0 sporulation family protein [Oceanirhabdus sp. W0125-5]WBW97493.1 stage 0 sporulation family protein [Oceanirhabdus sp. W0125-5]